MERFDVSVIGQGYAGLMAARLSHERGWRTANIEGQMMGGLIVNVNELDPAAAEAEPSGADLASGIAMKNMDDGVVSVSESVTAIEQDTDGSWRVSCGEHSHTARHVIVASGARLRKLRVPGEEEFFGQGVSECADCDGPMFAGMDTVIVGGGDSAFQEALALAHFAKTVTVMIRGDAPRARTDLRQRVAANPKLSVRYNTRVLAIEGMAGKGVQAVRIEESAGAQRTVATEGVFVFVGLEPNTGFLPSHLQRDAQGALLITDNGATNLPNVWAVGAVRSGFGGLLSDAAADAARVVANLG